MRYRQADLLCVADSAEPVKRSRQNVFDYRRSKTRRVCVYKEKTRIGTEKRYAFANQRIEVGFNAPHFAVGSSAVTGRIHEDTFVETPPPLLTENKFHYIINDKSNRFVGKS